MTPTERADAIVKRAPFEFTFAGNRLRDEIAAEIEAAIAEEREAGRREG